MCATCGCSDQPRLRLITGGADPDPAPGSGPGHDHGDGHEHGPGHDHGHQHDSNRTVLLQEKVLAKNDALAVANRAWLHEHEVLAVNLMSSPGAGKTTLLERTGRDLGTELGLSVIEGDQETALDASRISATGCRVVQINTGVGCHLDAATVGDALRALAPPPGSVVVIENVGNLVCPALFDLGEGARIVLASVTEGADKPVKYPHMFRQADLVLVTKTDLLPYVDFDVARHAADVKLLSPGAQLIPLSATTGDGLDAWYDWLRLRRLA